MDSLNNYRKLVKQLLTEYAEIPVFDSRTQNEIIFDLENAGGVTKRLRI